MIAIMTDKINGISQERYDRVICELQFHQLACTCGSRGCLEKHGKYTRSLRILGAKISIRIQRVRCRTCGRTHALLFSIMVPYSQIPLEDQRCIVEASDTGSKYDEILDRNCLIDEREISYILQRYRRHWKERLFSIGINVWAEDLLEQCSKHFSRGFMQIKKTPLTIFPEPT